MTVEGNLSNDFVEIIKNSTLSEEAKEAIRIISEGGIPSGKQVARPDLMNIIKFLMESYDCMIMIKESESKETEAQVEKPFNCFKCDKKFASKEDGCKHAETIIDLGMEAFKPILEEEEKSFLCSKCDKKFSKEDELKTHESTHTDICQHYRSGTCIYGGKGVNKEGKCPHNHPRKCTKFLNDINGCTTKDCTYFHPIVCKFIKIGRPCMVAGCTLAHPVAKAAKSGMRKENPSNAGNVTKGSKGHKFKGAKRDEGNGEENNNRRLPPPKTPGKKEDHSSFLGQEQILKMMETLQETVTLSLSKLSERMDNLDKERHNLRTSFNQGSFNSPWWR